MTVINTENTTNKEAWSALWEFAQAKVTWADGSIDFDSFFELGKDIFELKIKEQNGGANTV